MYYCLSWWDIAPTPASTTIRTSMYYVWHLVVDNEQRATVKGMLLFAILIYFSTGQTSGMILATQFVEMKSYQNMHIPRNHANDDGSTTLGHQPSANGHGLAKTGLLTIQNTGPLANLQQKSREHVGYIVLASGTKSFIHSPTTWRHSTDDRCIPYMVQSRKKKSAA